LHAFAGDGLLLLPPVILFFLFFESFLVTFLVWLLPALFIVFFLRNFLIDFCGFQKSIVNKLTDLSLDHLFRILVEIFAHPLG